MLDRAHRRAGLRLYLLQRNRRPQGPRISHLALTRRFIAILSRQILDNGASKKRESIYNSFLVLKTFTLQRQLI